MSDHRYREGSVTISRYIVTSIFIQNWVAKCAPSPVKFWDYIKSLGPPLDIKGDHLVQREIQVLHKTILPTFGSFRKHERVVLSEHVVLSSEKPKQAIPAPIVSPEGYY